MAAADSEADEKKSDAEHTHVFTDVDLVIAADTANVSLISLILDNPDRNKIKIDCQFPARHGAFNPGGTPLHYAARSGHLDIVKILVSKYKSDLKLVDFEVWNSLHYSCFCGHKDVTEYLYLTCHVDDSIVSKYEKSTPSGFARYRKFEDVASVFTNGADTNVSQFTSAQVKEKLARARKKTMRVLPANYSKMDINIENFNQYKIKEKSMGLYLNRYRFEQGIALLTFVNVLDCIDYKKYGTNECQDLVFPAVDTALTHLKEDFYNDCDKVWIRLCHSRDMAQRLCAELKKNGVWVLRQSAISAFHYIIVILGCNKNWVEFLKDGKSATMKSECKDVTVAKIVSRT